MNTAPADREDRFRTPTRSWPHARLSGALRGLGPQQVLNERDELGRNGAPAGGLALSAEDMATWLKIQLAHGALPTGGRLFSEEQAEKMWTPVPPMPIPPLPHHLQHPKPQQPSHAPGRPRQHARCHTTHQPHSGNSRTTT